MRFGCYCLARQCLDPQIQHPGPPVEIFTRHNRFNALNLIPPRCRSGKLSKWPNQFCIAALLAALPVFATPNLPVCNVRDFGAAGDGQHKDTSAIQSAIELREGGGGTDLLPPGRYLTGAVSLRSHITFDIGPGAVILGSEDPADYPLHESVYSDEVKSLSSLIYANGVEEVTLTGRGTIDGQGQIWWKRQWFATKKKNMPQAKTPDDFAEARKVANGRPKLIEIVRSKDVVIERLHLINSPSWTVHPLLCEFVRVDGHHHREPRAFAQYRRHQSGVVPQCADHQLPHRCRRRLRDPEIRH